MAAWLIDQGHDVFSVFDSARGADDNWVLEKAFLENRILVTNDKGFGEKIFRSGKAHHGVVLLRLSNETPAKKKEVFARVLESFADSILDAYVVANERRIRIVKPTL